MTAPSGAAGGVRRVRVRVEGVVQGVGFRPYVHRLAAELGVAGFVRNDERGVVIEAEGAPEAVEALLARLPAEAPPMAVDRRTSTPEVVPAARRGRVRDRLERAGRVAPTRSSSPDAATCEACLRELFDPADRRYRYPFINCTDCGPRFTIVRGVPYDRPLTTMAGFAMCARCAAEYHDPADRRFHAQPNACPDLRAAARPPARRGRGRAGRRRDRRGQGDRRVPPRVRGVGRAGGRDAAGAQAPRGEAVRADGAGSRGRRAAGGAGPGRDGAAARPRPPDRARAAAARCAGGRRGRARARPSSG